MTKRWLASGVGVAVGVGVGVLVAVGVGVGAPLCAFCGVGAPTVKSALLLSVSAPGVVRAAEVSAANGVGASGAAMGWYCSRSIPPSAS